MSVLNQKTIKEPIIIKGIGLHTGELSSIRILPAEPNSGIIFKRVDLKKNNYLVQLLLKEHPLPPFPK